MSSPAPLAKNVGRHPISAANLIVGVTIVLQKNTTGIIVKACDRQVGHRWITDEVTPMMDDTLTEADADTWPGYRSPWARVGYGNPTNPGLNTKIQVRCLAGATQDIIVQEIFG